MKEDPDVERMSSSEAQKLLAGATWLQAWVKKETFRASEKTSDVGLSAANRGVEWLQQRAKGSDT